MSLLTVRNLRVALPLGDGSFEPVRGVDLDLEARETLCVVGESGSGKSISSLSVMDLLPPGGRRTADRLDFAGIDLMGLSSRGMAALRGDRIAFVFQDPMTNLNPAYTIGNQLCEAFLRHGRGGRAEARARASYLLERVGIPNPRDRLAQYPHQLSGGLRQRVMLAMALMCGPELLIADEPTSALDVTIQVQLLALLRDIQREMGLGIILITHDLGVVSRIADRVAVMYAGQVVESGTRAQIFGDPQHPYTRGLIASIPGVAATPDGRLHTIPGMVPSLVDPIAGCAFADRCAFVEEACRVAPPPTVTREGHLCRCLRAVRPASASGAQAHAI